MRLLCPFCQKAITVPDTEAGKAVNCPECGQQFAAPQLYTPAPAPLSELPPLPSEKRDGYSPVPETYVGKGEPTHRVDLDLPDVPAPDRELSGYSHIASLPLEPHVLRWIPAAALFLTFVLTVFPWNGCFPAGYSAFTQNAWGAATGVMSHDDVAYEELRVGDSKTGDKVGDVLDKRLHMNLWLFPYLLLIFPTLLLAVAGPVVDMGKVKLPPEVQRYWQYRPVVLGVLATLLLLLLLAQWASGFGLQRAVNEWAEAEFAESKATATTPEKLQVWEMQVAMLKGKFHVKTTPWLRLAVLFHLLAAAAVLAEAGLMMRGTKPPPRVAAMW
jgi:hypothetical protein